MSDNESFETKLQRMNESSKANHRLDAAAKRQIMAQASDTNASRNVWQSATQWSYATAAVITLGILISLFKTEPMPEYYVIEQTVNQDQQTKVSHDVVASDFASPLAQKAEKLIAESKAQQQRNAAALQQSYDVYLAANANSASVRSQHGTLVKVDGDWQIMRCDGLLIELSARLVASLNRQDDNVYLLALGDNVDVVTNAKGHIVALKAGKSSTQCS